MYTVSSTLDAKKISALDMECFPQEFWSAELIEKDMQHSEYFVAQIADEIVGYVCVSSVLDEAELTRIAVLESHRHCGIATLLIEFIKKHLSHKGCKTLILEVRSSNTSAQALYHKMGFIAYAVRKKYYNNPNDDAILMSLKL